MIKKCESFSPREQYANIGYFRFTFGAAHSGQLRTHTLG